MTDCLFCKIANGEISSHNVWESEDHIAFLTIFPNMKGFTVVASKKHLPSNVHKLSDDEYISLFTAAKEVANRLALVLHIDRCALVAEGTAIDHAHIKVIPLIGFTPEQDYTEHNAKTDVSFDKYEGYITTLEGPRADDGELAKLAEMIRGGY